jgi:hypothetical protein
LPPTFSLLRRFAVDRSGAASSSSPEDSQSESSVFQPSDLRLPADFRFRDFSSGLGLEALKSRSDQKLRTLYLV